MRRETLKSGLELTVAVAAIGIALVVTGIVALWMSWGASDVPATLTHFVLT